MKVLIMSDIHGNESAYRSVLNSARNLGITGIILLGDLIDYGCHSNRVIDITCDLKEHILCNIWGNHEYAIINERYERFSSDRGRQSAAYTRSVLSDKSMNYITQVMTPSGRSVFNIDGKKVLAIHGSLDDEYWKAIKPGQDLSAYSRFDYVLSGHSHHPHFFEEYYSVDDPVHRNMKKTTFINPGSVGQPRNLCPYAQFAIWDTANDTFEMKKTEYDIKLEQSSFSQEIDQFYKDRLGVGI